MIEECYRVGRIYRLATDPDFESGHIDLDLHLTYDGALLATKNGGRPGHVHEIRKRFHSQLKRFWRMSPSLTLIEDLPGRIERLANGFKLGDYRFVPLANRDQQYSCAIHVLLLRPPESGGTVLNRTDIDGQLATLFDALSKPRHLEQMRDNPKPDAEEDPFFVLVEDDSLITQVSVETDFLLETTSAGIDRNAARAIIRAQLSWPPSLLGYARWS